MEEREKGQALLLALGGTFVLLSGALALVAIAGAVTGKGRAQRAADLAAISAARSMRDDLPRLLSAPALPDGTPDPRHLTKAVYLARARTAALEASRANGVAFARLRLSFPDGGSFAPVRARAVVLADVDVGDVGTRVEASAVAEAGAPASPPAATTMASGGGYSGPLASDRGRGCARTWPPPSTAWPRQRARAGLALVVNSAFRSDAEQAALFAAHPDPALGRAAGHSRCTAARPSWTSAPPPPTAGWPPTRAASASSSATRWEAWHFGFAAGPRRARPPATAGGRDIAGPGRTAARRRRGLPAFVPARFRAPILRAATTGTSPRPCSPAQLMAESNFDPYAGSPAGAQGIAQFMPATAAAYGLRDPYDPEEAIDAQAHLMSDLLRQFGVRPWHSPPTTQARLRSKPATASRPTPRRRPT